MKSKNLPNLFKAHERSYIQNRNVSEFFAKSGRTISKGEEKTLIRVQSKSRFEGDFLIGPKRIDSEDWGTLSTWVV